jgi:hypothetical protein
MSFSSTPIGWYLNTYTASTWTDLATNAPAVIRSISVVNTSTSSINIQMQVTNTSGTSLSLVLNTLGINAGISAIANLPIISLSSNTKFQVWADTVGINFYASGAY